VVLSPTSVQPLISGYLYRLQVQLRERGIACPLLLMTSGGGLTTLEQAARLPIRLSNRGRPAADG